MRKLTPEEIFERWLSQPLEVRQIRGRSPVNIAYCLGFPTETDSGLDDTCPDCGGCLAFG